MGFVDINIDAPENLTPSLFRFEAVRGGPAGETDAGAAESTADETGGSQKRAALGLLVVLGFLVVTGLLAKRKLGGGADADVEVDVA